MTSVSFLYTQSDSANAETLKNLVQARLGTRTDVKTTRDMIAEVAEVAEGEVVKDGLTISDCVVLIGSRQASSMIQNNQQEIEDGSPLFDGSLISSMFTAKHGRLVIVFFSKKDENDWIPPEFDSNKIFHFCDGEIDPPTLNQLVDCIKGILSRKN